MTPPQVVALEAEEILDSRGIPTVAVTLVLDTGRGHIPIQASVPSGKSTGLDEAHERRDGDPDRYHGKGVLAAVAAVTGEIAAAFVGRTLPTQLKADDMLVALDGTPNKSRLGANAVLGVSIAVARATAAVRQQPLFASLARDVMEDGIQKQSGRVVLPVPCLNVLNGGVHADNALDFQEFMVVPAGFDTYSEALRAGVETYHALAACLAEDGLSTTVGDEGGFAPAIAEPEEALTLLMRAIDRAHYRAGEQVFLALDPAATTFYRNGHYVVAGVTHTAEELIDRYTQWTSQYPILSIEDGLAEGDEAGWHHMTHILGGRVQLVGDDIFVSHPQRVHTGIERRLANAVLLKPNQIGTISELAITATVARAGGFGMMISHRSGETDDTFVSDLAVALETGQIKAGAPARSERVAKYNRLLGIEREVGAHAHFIGRIAFTGTERAGRYPIHVG